MREPGLGVLAQPNALLASGLVNLVWHDETRDHMALCSPRLSHARLASLSHRLLVRCSECWAQEPADRPAVDDVVGRLQALLREETSSRAGAS